MKKPIDILAVSCSILLTGCFSLETTPLVDADGQSLHLQSTKGKAAEHVVVSNFGWYLFNRWPLFCGNARIDRSTPWVFFRNDVNENVLQSRLMKYAAARNCDATDINLFNNSEVLMSIGVGGVSIPLPYLISYRELQYSCSLIENDKSREAKQKSDKREMRNLNEEMRKLLDKIPDGDKAK